MSNGKGSDQGRSPIMELFRLEAENHCATITDQLLALEKNPASPDLLEVLIRAAHSIKGAAQVVDLPAAFRMGKAMERIFVDAQAGKIAIGRETIEALHHGVEILNDLAMVGDSEIDPWLDDHAGRIDSLVERYNSLADSGEAEPAAAGIREERGPAPARGTEESSGKGLDDLFDMSMLELFRMEAENHCNVITNSLLKLEKSPSDPKILESLMRAAHSVKGAARVVDLHSCVQLAHAMEDVFVAAQHGTISLERQDIDLLLRGVDLLTDIAHLSDEEATSGLAALADDIATLVKALAALAVPQAAPAAKSPVKPRQAESRAESRAESEVRPAEVSGPEGPGPETPGQDLFGDTPAASLPANPAPEAGLARPGEESPEKEPSSPAAPVKSPRRPADDSKRKTVTAAAGDSGAGTRGSGQDKSGARIVRIAAENMNRLMGLAGEVLVETGRIPALTQRLLRLKKRQDEVLRQLDKTSEEIGKAKGGFKKNHFYELRQKIDLCRGLLIDHMAETENHSLRANEISHRLYQEVVASRMQPLADGIQAFPRLVRDLARELDKEVNLEVVGAETMVDRDILEKIESPLNHLIRNAIDHGIEGPAERREAGKPGEATIRIEARHSAGMLNIVVSDDGRGVDTEKLRRVVVQKNFVSREIAADLTEPELLEFLFLPNFSTKESVDKVSGRGVGLDVVHSVLNEVRGVVRASSTLGQGTSFDLQLPLTLSVMRALLTEISGEPYAFPLVAIDHVLRLPRRDIKEIEGRQYFIFNDRRIGLVAAQQVFEQPLNKTKRDLYPVVVFSDRFSQYGVILDQFWGIRDLVVQPLNPSLGKIKDISAAAILEDGTPALIIDVEDMVRSLDILISDRRLIHVRQRADEEINRAVKQILVADDSITVREVERKMLSAKGYQVDVAIDGMDALNNLRNGNYNLLVTDIDMPRMDGIELVNVVKGDARLKSIPIIIVSYKDREEDRNRGLEAGADYYLTKGSFQDETLVNAVQDLIGDPEV